MHRILSPIEHSGKFCTVITDENDLLFTPFISAGYVSQMYRIYEYVEDRKVGPSGVRPPIF